MLYDITFRVIETTFYQTDVEADSLEEALKIFEEDPHKFDWEAYECGDVHNIDQIECEGYTDNEKYVTLDRFINLNDALYGAEKIQSEP